MRITTQVEFSYGSAASADPTFYVPSDDEVRGYAAWRRGDGRLALAYFDAAIARDPSRGARVYTALTRAGAAIAHVYWSFFKAALESSDARQKAASAEVYERCAARRETQPWGAQVVAWLEPPRRDKQA